MTRRITEAEIDIILLRNFSEPGFASAVLAQLGLRAPIQSASRQSRHRRHTGTIDIELRLEDRTRVLIENKIDAAYSVTRDGDAQPERYRASVAQEREAGYAALSVLTAPNAYLSASRHAAQFDRLLSYEVIADLMHGVDRALLREAIVQAATPYEPEPNERTGGFFARFRSHVAAHYPALYLKPEPNAKAMRPTDSRTIYFDVARTRTPICGCRRRGCRSSVATVARPALR